MAPDCGEYGHAEGACGNASCMRPDNDEAGVERALLAAGTTGVRQVWFSRPEAASAVRNALASAQADYAERAKKWRDYGEGMHQRAMRAEAALRLAQRMCREALPKFNWGASPLDANAIDLLNRAPTAIDEALTPTRRTT